MIDAEIMPLLGFCKKSRSSTYPIVKTDKLILFSSLEMKFLVWVVE